jgi:hypothetical protein
MYRILAMLLGLLLMGHLQGQDRHATVTLSDGKVLAGKVVAMDLATLQLLVGEEVVTLAAADIKTCQFDDGATPVSSDAGGGQPPPVAAAHAPETKVTATPPPTGAAGEARVRLPLPDPVVEGQDDAPVPHDLRRSRLRGRLELLDQAYPWLVPTEPIQWISIGLLLFAFLSLTVHVSTSVVGAEVNAAGRCMALAAWYLLTTLLQVALVPAVQLATCIMLIANPALALFWLRNLFGLTRGASVIAYAVQLGFVLLGYGVLELVTSLLGSIGASHA